ncbi:MAG: PfaB family protein [Cyanobacteria bacterium P01_A01_bin.80]
MEKIAIIGYSCLFPDANNPDQFWENLIEGKESTSSISSQEMGIDPEVFYNPFKGKPDKFYSLKGAFIRDFHFDAQSYNLPADFLKGLDDTFKWSLYVAKQALQHSGYRDSQTLLAKCGVILGTLSLPTKFSNQLFASIYQKALNPILRDLLQDKDFQLPLTPLKKDTIEPSLFNAMISGLPAAIIAQALSLSHNHFCIDAACSSPLYATKLATHYLWTHKSDLMLVGGISCADPLFLRMLFSGIQGYPENNDISRPFDKTSRGLATADGAGMVVLKRYSDALRDGDRIYATICSTGLSNDGKGKHLLSPNSQGQVLAFERAYQEAQLNPQDIDYMECHATGTLLGDNTELESVQTFFGKYKAAPLVGSGKSNTGHLLTAAGTVGMLKVVLGMNQGIIPGTINVSQPIGDSNSVINSQNIVRSNTPWETKNGIKRAAISAFGLGGTDAHMILEARSTPENANEVESEPPVEPVKMAIVGMDAFFGGCNGLDAFERSIYEGRQHFKDLPSSRWHGLEKQTDLLDSYGLQDGQAPQGAYIEDFKFDALAHKIPPNELEKLNKQQLLLLEVSDRALRDADIQPGENVAVLIATETELSVHQLQQRWNLSWQIKEGLIAGDVSLPPEKLAQLEEILQDGIHQAVDSSEYVSYIANIMASRVASLWNFKAPTFTISAGENSTFKVLEVAQHLLTTTEADAVLVGAVDLAGGLESVLLHSKQAKINTGNHTLAFDEKVNGWMVGEGAGAVVLKRHDSAKASDNRIYAVVDAIAMTQQHSSEVKANRLTPPSEEMVERVCNQAIQDAGIKSGEIDYLEVFGSGIQEEDTAEIKGLLKSYPGDEQGFNCAIGSVKSNIGHTYVASGIASLIKTALCLYYRYIPATPKWSGVKDETMWRSSRNRETSPFYVSGESRPWFLGKGVTKRIAAINSMGADGTYAHAILSEEVEQNNRRNSNSKYLQQTPYYLFPLTGEDRKELLERVENLQVSIENSASLATTATETFKLFQERSHSLNNSQNQYTLAILGRNQKELTREITNAIKGVNNAFDKGDDWQTPQGSYFTANPLGKKGEIAYVYPAAVNSYIGIGRNLFRLFPQVHDDPAIKSAYSLVEGVSRLVFPRSLNKLSIRELEKLEQNLLDNSIATFETDMAFAKLITSIIRDDFSVKPKVAFGYSLGETSMMCAIGVWKDITQSLSNFHASPLFSDRISGKKNTIRSAWGLSTQDYPNNDFWHNYVLITTPLQARESLEGEERAYLTQINTPEEVVIAGEQEACGRVIKNLGCNAFRAPFDHVIHCDAMASEFEEIARANTSPIPDHPPDITVYSAGAYAPIKIGSNSIAQNIAKCLCQPLDFTRLVERVHNDGAKIFIETGAGNVCSRWIDKILSKKEHICISLNRRGLDDHSGIVKALAKLVSHQVNVDLSLLYDLTLTTTKKSQIGVRSITLGGEDIPSKILTSKNYQIFQNSLKKEAKSQLTAKSSVPQVSIPKSTPKAAPKPAPANPPVEAKVPATIKENLKQNSPQNSPDISKSSHNNTNSDQTPPDQIQKVAMKNISANSTKIETPLQSAYSTPPKQIASPSLSVPPKSESDSFPPTSIPQISQSQYQQISTNNFLLHRTHAAFLQSRQEFSQQISEIIKLQLFCAENLLNE